MQVPVYSLTGEVIEHIEISDQVFTVPFNRAVVHQVMVRQQANARQGTASVKTRSEVSGSSRKLFRQKGTGNARMGTVRTNIRKGGGVAFAKTARDFRQKMPKKQRRLARDSAILAKLLSNNVVVVDELNFDAPKTKNFSVVLDNLKIDRSCLVAVDEHNENLYKSVRNIPKVDTMVVSDLNAGDICSRQKILFTKNAFMTLIADSVN